MDFRAHDKYPTPLCCGCFWLIFMFLFAQGRLRNNSISSNNFFDFICSMPHSFSG